MWDNSSMEAIDILSPHVRQTNILAWYDGYIPQVTCAKVSSIAGTLCELDIILTNDRDSY